MAQNPSYVSMVSDPSTAQSHPVLSSPVPMTPALLPSAKRAESSLVDTLRFSRFTVSPALEPHRPPSCDTELVPTAGKGHRGMPFFSIILCRGGLLWDIVRKENSPGGALWSLGSIPSYRQERMVEEWFFISE